VETVATNSPEGKNQVLDERDVGGTKRLFSGPGLYWTNMNVAMSTSERGRSDSVLHLPCSQERRDIESNQTRRKHEKKRKREKKMGVTKRNMEGSREKTSKQKSRKVQLGTFAAWKRDIYEIFCIRWWWGGGMRGSPLTWMLECRQNTVC